MTSSSEWAYRETAATRSSKVTLRAMVNPPAKTKATRVPLRRAVRRSQGSDSAALFLADRARSGRTCILRFAVHAARLAPRGASLRTLVALPAAQRGERA